MFSSTKIILVIIIIFSNICSFSEEIIECHPVCKTCDGKTLLDCTSCFNNSVLGNETCSCNDGYYMDLDFSCKQISQNNECLFKMDEYYNGVEIVNWSEFDTDSLLSTLNIQISPALPIESECYSYDLVGVILTPNLSDFSYIQLRNWTVNNSELYSKITLVTKRDDFLKIGCTQILDDEKDSFKCQIMLRFLFHDSAQETYDFFVTTTIQKILTRSISFTSPTNMILGTCLKSSCNMSSLPESELTFCKNADCITPSDSIVFNQDETIFLKQKLLNSSLRSTYELNIISFIMINNEDGAVYDLIGYFNSTKANDGIIYSLKVPLAKEFGFTLILKSSMNKKNAKRVLQSIVHEQVDYDRLAIESRSKMLVRTKTPNDNNLFHFPNIQKHLFAVLIFFSVGVIILIAILGVYVSKNMKNIMKAEDKNKNLIDMANTSENIGIKQTTPIIT